MYPFKSATALAGTTRFVAPLEFNEFHSHLKEHYVPAFDGGFQLKN